MNLDWRGVNMGSIISAACTNCGFEDDRVVIGGGLKTFKEHSAWPVNCQECKTLRSANIVREPLACSTCGSTRITIYGSRVQRQAKSSFEENDMPAASWGDYQLKSGPHMCPRCSTEGLVFQRGPSMFFD